MKPTVAVTSTVLVLTLTAGLSVVGSAQGTGRSLNIDWSVRSAGMGGASNALFWGDGTDQWGNPSLLGYVRGVGYEWGHTKLLPGLADDIVFSSHTIKIGGGGLGIALSGKPFDMGGAKLDYGESEGTDDMGNSTGTFGSFEEIDAWGIGVNVAEAVESILGLGGVEALDLSRYGDVSFGTSFKDLDIKLAPAIGGSTSARDWGLLVRATPILTQGPDGALMRLDLAYGRSELSYNDDALVRFPNETQALSVSHHERQGYAARVAMSPPRWPPDGGWGKVVDPSAPMASLGLTVDRVDIGLNATSGWGIEASLADAIVLRVGHQEDKLGDVSGATWGWSFGLPLGGVARIRYEEARVPQATGSSLPDLTRRGLSLWLDPVGIWRAARHE